VTPIPPYVQVLGHQSGWRIRFLLCDEDGSYHLWFGDRPSRPLESIPIDLAAWLRKRPEFVPAPRPLPWVAIADLPVAPAPLSTSFSPPADA
jgi:hypothetical protein